MYRKEDQMPDVGFRIVAMMFLMYTIVSIEQVIQIIQHNNVVFASLQIESPNLVEVLASHVLVSAASNVRHQ